MLLHNGDKINIPSRLRLECRDDESAHHFTHSIQEVFQIEQSSTDLTSSGVPQDANEDEKLMTEPATLFRLGRIAGSHLRPVVEDTR